MAEDLNHSFTCCTKETFHQDIPEILKCLLQNLREPEIFPGYTSQLVNNNSMYITLFY